MTARRLCGHDSKNPAVDVGIANRFALVRAENTALDQAQILLKYPAIPGTSIPKIEQQAWLLQKSHICSILNPNAISREAG